MATRLGLTNGQHTAGIYSDMTVDGPEIGTLVVVVDRAKNLPNRRTMGKQDPYCAARLGKEAKKTETDLRGGQTPRWDQELRFTVHDSPDYHNIKVSVFNDDKKTDLIGEAWINLWDVVITPGGGRADSWHGLSYRGKYAGEIRMEMSYYDSRTPEKPPTPHDSLKKRSPVKRRPLPAGPSPTVVPQFGPRTMGCSRGSTVYLDDEGNKTIPPPEPADQFPEPEQVYNTMQPDFLPQIPPRQAHRVSSPYGREAAQSPAPSSFQNLSHSQSTPNFHAHPYPRDRRSTNGESEQYPVYPEHTSQMDGSEWDNRSIAPSQFDHQQQWEQGSQFDVSDLPPLPPSHSGTPQHQRQRSYDQQSVVSSVSPLQTLERSSYAASSAGSSRPLSEYQTPIRGQNNPSPLRREVPGAQAHAHPASGPSSPFSRSVGSSPAAAPAPQHSYLPHPGINRHSVSDPYMTTPPRQQAHPLSQEMPRPVSPQPYHGNQGYEEPSNYHFPEDLALARPQPVTHTPRARHSIAAIRHPIASYAASQSPVVPENRMVLASPGDRVTPTRKEVGSRATPPGSEAARSSMPFSPDSFDAYNPSSRSSQLDAQPSPHSPWHIPVEPKRAASSKDTGKTEVDPSKPIVGFDGRVIDPSDHLPVDSWAPEPEVKTPTRGYAGSNHSFGPRSVQVGSAGGSANGPRKGNIVVNVRTRDRTGMGMGYDTTSPGGGLTSSPAAAPGSPSSPTRNRLVKKSSPVRSSPVQPHSAGALREIAVPNPYAGSTYGGGYGSEYGSPDAGHPPPKPPKIPLGDLGEGPEAYGYGSSALSREMAKIDIGGIGGGRRPPRGAAVGMRYPG